MLYAAVRELRIRTILTACIAAGVIGVSSLPVGAATCAFVWGEVTTNTLGETVTNLGGYHLYRAATADGHTLGQWQAGLPLDALGDPSNPGATLSCETGQWWTVTAYDTKGLESNFSNVIEIGEMPPPPAALEAPGSFGIDEMRTSKITTVEESTVVSFGPPLP